MRSLSDPHHDPVYGCLYRQPRPYHPSTEAPTSEAAFFYWERQREPNAIPADGSELGEGQHSFTFQVQMADGTAYHYTVHTDEETVGAALVDLGPHRRRGRLLWPVRHHSLGHHPGL